MNPVAYMSRRGQVSTTIKYETPLYTYEPIAELLAELTHHNNLSAKALEEVGKLKKENKELKDIIDQLEVSNIKYEKLAKALQDKCNYYYSVFVKE